MKNIEKYSAGMRTMHWLVGVLILGMLVVGLYMTSDLALPENRMKLYSLHKSFGLVVIVLVIIRIVSRLRSKIPPLPSQISIQEQRLSLLGHYAMYVLITIIPISGFLMSEIGGYTVIFFGFEIPHFLPQSAAASKFFNKAHFVLNYTLIFMIFIHFSAPFKHYFVDKVNIWKRMT